MTHRSNQAVASQGQPAPQGGREPGPQRVSRLLVGWTTALAALGVSTLALGGALWLMRFPLAEFMINAALAERGVDADFDIVALDFERLVLSDVLFGAAADPDASLERLEATWSWSGLSPRVDGLRLSSPQLRVRLTPEGAVSFGALDRVRATPGARRFRIPAIQLEIDDGQVLILAPFGGLRGDFAGAGTLGVNFAASGVISETSHPGGLYRLESGAADFAVISRENTIAIRLDASARELIWDGARVTDAQARISGEAPLDLARYDLDANWRFGSLHTPDIAASELEAVLSAEAVAQNNSINPEVWHTRLRIESAAATVFSNRFAGLRAEAQAEGGQERAQASWSFTADRFEGLSTISEQPAGAGVISVALDTGNVEGQAQLNLQASRLNSDAQERLRRTFPDLGGTPVGPTFARAERTLDAAADRFDLAIPLSMNGDADQFRLVMTAPAEAHASTGARLRVSPLRQDLPALVLQWPGPTLSGAIAAELSGGGGPDATLLLDTVHWAARAPFEGDGTLTLANWRAEGSSIAANELGFSLSVSPGGQGRMDLRGPVHITGPVADGQVRELVPVLDIAIMWRPGWRVVPNGCLPTRLGGLDVAGLSFGAGNFELCALEGALIAADANNNLSGGFLARQLALNGRLAGPAAQPARLTSSSVSGLFRGRPGDIALAVEADAPRLAIDMGEQRTLALALRRLTANAQLGESWRVDGAFESGTLSDPALPGSVSTIEGSWSAQPENGSSVIRVASADALVTANRPASEAERPLFQPMRLSDVSAILRQGRLEATGDIVLESQQRQLAAFTAWHEMQEGVGAARVTAPNIVFTEALQPFQITERARGTIEDVRGPASVTADITWSREELLARGALELGGVSFATTTLPIVQNVRGVVMFDNLFALTTPPGQEVSVGLLNPGIAVRDGRIRFQLLPDQRINIEGAAFQFAGGVLAMQPTSVTLGQSETQIVLTLTDVDAASLIAALNIPDLAATGRLEGTFPLRLTARTAYVENGVLYALSGGGRLSYTGDAGRNATGVTRIAFDALRGFDYDTLSLRLNGDITGDVLTEIEFSGQNTGRPVDLGPIAPVPGLGSVTVRGVPFVFNVRINAPFRRLARTAASITDPAALLNRANDQEGADVDVDVQVEPTPVDPEPPGTR